MGVDSLGDRAKWTGQQWDGNSEITEDLRSYKWTRNLFLEGHSRSGTPSLSSLMIDSDMVGAGSKALTGTAAFLPPNSSLLSSKHHGSGSLKQGNTAKITSEAYLKHFLLETQPEVSCQPHPPALCTHSESWHRRVRAAVPITPLLTSGPLWLHPCAAHVGHVEHQPFLCVLSSGAPTLADDELLHALLVLVGGLQALSCALKELLLFGHLGSQFQELSFHCISLEKRNRLILCGFATQNKTLLSSQHSLNCVPSLNTPLKMPDVDY